MMRLARAIALLSLSLAAPHPLKAASYCDQERIPLLRGDPAGRLEGSTFVSGRYSTGAVTFYNTFSKPIYKLSIYIEFLDPSGKALVGLLFQAGPRRPPEPPFPYERGYFVDWLSKPIAPGSRLLLNGFSPLTTAACPSRARLMLLSIVFDDRSMHFWAMPKWRIWGVPEKTEAPFKLPPALVPKPTELLARAALSPKGRIEGLSPLEPVDPNLFDNVRSQVALWSFAPTIEDGKPVQEELVFLFRFHPHLANEAMDWELAPDRRPELPFVVIDVFLMDAAEGRWEVSYGDRWIRAE